MRNRTAIEPAKVQNQSDERSVGCWPVQIEKSPIVLPAVPVNNSVLQIGGGCARNEARDEQLSSKYRR